MDNELQAALRNLHTTLLELHQTLIAATRQEYEGVHGRVNNPYDMFHLVAHDPAFAWLQPLTSLLVQIDDLLGQEAITTKEASAIRSAAELLVQPPENIVSPFHERLRASRQSEPSLVVTHTHVRQALAALPRNAQQTN